MYSRDVKRHALVEHERDVGPERRLHFHRRLRRHEAAGAVEIRAEGDAVLADREDRSRTWRGVSGRPVAGLRRAPLDLVGDRPVPHGEDLAAAGIGDHRPVPRHEAVQSAQPSDQVVAGRQEEVEREHHVEAQLARFAHFQGLDHPLGRQRDERRRPDLAVLQAQSARPRRAGVIAGVYLEARHGRSVRARAVRRSASRAAPGRPSPASLTRGSRRPSRPRRSGRCRCPRWCGPHRPRRRSRFGAACSPRAWGCEPRARRPRSRR